MRRTCSHNETYLNTDPQLVARTKGGVRSPLEIPIDWAKYHDCDYVDARNALIPSAERIAKKALRDQGFDPNKLLSENSRKLWSRTFLDTMDRLWKARAASRFPSTSDPGV